MATLLGNVLIDGISYGMVLFVIAVGLGITLGLMRFINLAHGAFAMLGGYLAAWLVRDAGVGFALGVALAVLATSAFGAVAEATVLRRLYGRSDLEQVLFTIGLTFFLVATVNLFFGPQVQLLPLPETLSRPVDLGWRTLPAQRLLVIGTGVAVALAGGWMVARTRFGVWLRAAVDNADTAASLGIPIRTVQCATFAVGCGLAALGAVLGAELMPLEPYYALKYLVLVLVVVAVGGMGSIVGALAAALLLGTVETASKYFASEFGSVFFYAAMAVLLAWRPAGLLRPRS
jgi:branched-chain amino acid transport system permease protein